MIQRVADARDPVRRDLGVACRRRQSGMTQQDLDDADICARFQEMGRKRVPQRMDRDRLT
jgi:hypothetical protein